MREFLPLSDHEDAICAIVDRLTVIELLLTMSTDGLSPEDVPGIERIISDVLVDAKAVRAAWYEAFALSDPRARRRPA